MSTYYRDRREAGIYTDDEEAREKAGAKFDKQWEKQMVTATPTPEEEGQSGTAAK